MRRSGITSASCAGPASQTCGAACCDGADQSCVYDYDTGVDDACCRAPATAVCGGKCIAQPAQFCCVGPSADQDQVCAGDNIWCAMQITAFGMSFALAAACDH